MPYDERGKGPPYLGLIFGIPRTGSMSKLRGTRRLEEMDGELPKGKFRDKMAGLTG